MKSIWQWVGSPSYWKLAAIITGVYLTIAVLGKTGDWWFAASTSLGFYLCWVYATFAHGIKGEA
jgi:hypothetical protein